MKKTISIIAFFAMVCMFSNGIAETGYVIVKIYWMLAIHLKIVTILGNRMVRT